MTPSTPAPPRYTEYADHLTKQIALWRVYLRADDKAARLVGLRAIREFIDALIGQEYAAPPAKAPASAATDRPSAKHWLRGLISRRFP